MAVSTAKTTYTKPPTLGGPPITRLPKPVLSRFRGMVKRYERINDQINKDATNPDELPPGVREGHIQKSNLMCGFTIGLTAAEQYFDGDADAVRRNAENILHRDYSHAYIDEEGELN